MQLQVASLHAYDGSPHSSGIESDNKSETGKSRLSNEIAAQGRKRGLVGSEVRAPDSARAKRNKVRICMMSVYGTYIAHHTVFIFVFCQCVKAYLNVCRCQHCHQYMKMRGKQLICRVIVRCQLHQMLHRYITPVTCILC